MEKNDLATLSFSSPLEDASALHAINYGLYIVTTRENGKDSGLVVNTVSQVGSNPTVIAVGISHANFSRDVIARTGKLGVSVLTESAPFSLFERFGFQSGRNADKMKGLCYGRSDCNLPMLTEHSRAFFALSVQSAVQLPSHTLFLCTVEESYAFSTEKAMTYAYYHANVKPKKEKTGKKGFVCKICGYIHEKDTLPSDFICPICKHPASDFEKL